MSACATAASHTVGTASDDTAEKTIDATGLHVLPGLIDPHVHLRDPGDKAVETIPTGTKAAILGGLTAVFDMPNTSPSIVDAEKLAWKQDYVEERRLVRHGPLCRRHQDQHSGARRTSNSPAASAPSRSSPAAPPAT